MYCISLDRRPDRWRGVEVRFRRWGLSVERVPAVDGSQIVRKGNAPLAEDSQLLSAGEAGRLRSHRKTIELARRCGCERILVLEDDVHFHRRFLERFQEIATVSDDWNLLYLGCSQYDRSRLEGVNEHLITFRSSASRTRLILLKLARRLAASLPELRELPAARRHWHFLWEQEPPL